MALTPIYPIPRPPTGPAVVSVPLVIAPLTAHEEEEVVGSTVKQLAALGVG